jgi:hypothetical protein
MLRLFAGAAVDLALIVAALCRVVCQDALEAALDAGPLGPGEEFKRSRIHEVLERQLRSTCPAKKSE